MDDAQLRQALQQKQQNPRLKRIPLNLGTRFLNFSQAGAQITIDNPLTKYPVLLLIFGSEWVQIMITQCNITKPFIKLLKNHYTQINLQIKNLQIIYISLDKSKKDFDGFVNGMPWLGIAFDDPRVKDLKQFYNVRSIPDLILVDQNGQIIDNDCRSDVYNLGEDQAFEKWKKLKQMLKQSEKQSVTQPVQQP